MDTWLSPEEAVRFGLADVVEPLRLLDIDFTISAKITTRDHGYCRMIFGRQSKVHIKLSTIHARYNIYLGLTVGKDLERSIVGDIGKIPEIKYLHDFYFEYLNNYQNLIDSNTFLLNDQPNDLSGAAINVDLPYIGREVINTQKARYVFIFEGSLQPNNSLSNTVLSCLWGLEDVNQYAYMIDKYSKIKKQKGRRTQGI